MVDYRSEPSESAEGAGIARRALDAYASSTQRATGVVLDPMAKAWARRFTEDTMGFWLLWHLLGGFEGLERFGMHKSTIWRKVRKFRQNNGGKHPDEFEMPGVVIDRVQFWDHFSDALNKRL
jgi:hypothetical protein